MTGTDTADRLPEGALRILAVCSGGGHWVQMRRLRPAFEGHQVTYATVKPPHQSADAAESICWIPDANRDTKLRLVFLLLRLGWLMLRYRPQAVVTTGAAPGYLAIRLGRLIGAKTLFLDSLANAESLSLSADMAQRYADVTLTQWEHLAGGSGPGYWGTVL